MPVDSEGNRADIIMDPNSTISRMNLGRIYEIYTNAANRDTHKLICKILGVKTFSKNAINILKTLDISVINNAFNTLLDYYKIITPVMYNWYIEGKVTESHIEVLSHIVEHGVYLHLPPDNQPESIDIVEQIENSIYKPTYGPVSYIGNSGKLVTTKNPVRIASMYFILLEKTGDDWAAVSSCKLSHFGVLSQLTKIDKFSKPSRNQAVRGAGEAEVRIFSSYCGEKFTAELMDRNNSPKTHKHMINNLIKSDKPTNIKSLVDRSVIPYGGSKPLSIAGHYAIIGGWSFHYKSYMPFWKI